MTPREQRMFDILNTIAYESRLCSDGTSGNYYVDYYEVECNDIQAARDLIREIEQEEAEEEEDVQT